MTGVLIGAGFSLEQLSLPWVGDASPYIGPQICLPNGGILESSSTARARVAIVEPAPGKAGVRGVQPPRNVESEWSPTSIGMASGVQMASTSNARMSMKPQEAGL